MGEEVGDDVVGKMVGVEVMSLLLTGLGVNLIGVMLGEKAGNNVIPVPSSMVVPSSIPIIPQIPLVGGFSSSSLLLKQVNPWQQSDDDVQPCQRDMQFWFVSSGRKNPPQLTTQRRALDVQKASAMHSLKLMVQQEFSSIITTEDTNGTPTIMSQRDVVVVE